MNYLIFVLLFIGMACIFLGYIRSRQQCEPPIIEYRYVPRTFEEQQNEPVSVMNIFNNMFLEPSPWVNNRLLGPANQRNTDPNKFFISQNLE